MARMRSGRSASAPSLPTANGAGGSAGGESPHAAELLQHQVEFNQALVSAITTIAEHLRQLRAVDKPAAADQRANDVLPRVEALAAQVSDLAQRIDQAIAAFSTAVQSQGTLIQGLTSRLDVLDQTLAAAQQHAAARVSELEQRMASGQAAAEQVHPQLAAVSRATKEQFAETELRLFRLQARHAPKHEIGAGADCFAAKLRVRTAATSPTRFPLRLLSFRAPFSRADGSHSAATTSVSRLLCFRRKRSRSGMWPRRVRSVAHRAPALPSSASISTRTWSISAARVDYRSCRAICSSIWRPSLSAPSAAYLFLRSSSICRRTK